MAGMEKQPIFSAFVTSKDRRGNVIPLHRTPLAAARPREERDLLPASPPARIDCADWLNRGRPDPVEHLRGRLARRTTLDKMIDALDSPVFLPVYLAFMAGMFFTLAMAWLWSAAL